MKISSDTCSVDIGHNGFIERTQVGSFQSIGTGYLVVFKDYSRQDPTCRLWNIENDLIDPKTTETEASYTKIAEQFNILNRIKAHKNGWDWEIEIAEEYKLGHRFGVSVPLPTTEIYDFNKPIITPIAQFFRSTDEVFPDQTYLELPLVYAKYEKYFCSVFSSMDTDCQFFIYTDGTQPYVRITKSTNVSNVLKVHFRVYEILSDLKNEYQAIYPQSDKYLNVWKPLIADIQKESKLHIEFIHEDLRISHNHEELLVKKINNDLLDKYATIVVDELKKYPPTFLKESGIDGIFICSNILMNNIKFGSFRANGLFSNNKTMHWILWDISSFERWIIHHEIFHALHQKYNIPLLPGGSCVYSKQSDDVVEHCADLFASIMCNSLDNSEWGKNQHDVFVSYFAFMNKHEVSESNTVIYMIHDNQVSPLFFGELPHLKDCAVFKCSIH